MPGFSWFFRAGRGAGRTLGLHVEGERLTLVALEAGDPPTLLEAGSFSVADGEAAVSGLLRRHGLRRQPAALCLAPGDYELINLDRPPVPDEELVDAVRWKVGDLLPFPVDEAVLDVFAIPGLDRHARAADWVFVVAARRELVERQIELAGRLGLTPRHVDIPDFALRNLNERLADPQQSVAHLLVRAEDSLLCVTRGDVLYFSRDLPRGMASAEDSPIGGPFDDLVLEVQRSLDYFDRHFSQPPVARLFLSPGGEARAALRQALTDGLGVPVEVPNLSGVLAGGESLESSGLAEEPALLLALGAALRDLPALQEEVA